MKIDLQRILLIRTDRIGDVVLTAPMASILKREYPQAEIVFMARRYTAAILEYHRDIDHVLVYDPEGKHRGWKGHLALAGELQSWHFDIAFLFYPTFPLAWSLFQAGIPRRVAMGFRWYAPLFINWKVYEHRKHSIKHELEYNLGLLEKFVEHRPGEIAFHFQIPRSMATWREEFLQRLGIGGDYAILHPGNGGSAPNLSVKQYQHLLRELLDKTTMVVFLTGSPEEKILGDQILTGIDTMRVYDLIGKLSLKELIACIAGARLFLSSSTGPLHIANAFGIPVLAFYCPAVSCSPRRWGPYHQMNWVLTPDVSPCKLCQPARCPHGNCLEKIPSSLLTLWLEKRLETLTPG